MNEKFDHEFEEEQVSLAEYLRIIYRGRWIILAAFLIVFTAGVYYTYTVDPEYQASTSIIIESSGAMERSFFEMNYLGNQNSLIANQMEILKSRTLAERVVKRLNLSEVRDSLQLFRPNDDGAYPSLRAMAASIQGRIEVEHKRDTDILIVTYSAGNAFEAAYVTNVIADEFQLQNAEANRSEVTELRTFLEKQVDRKQGDLTVSEEALRAYQEREKVASLDEETSELVTRLAEVESMLEEARIELQSNLEMKRSLMEKLDERKQQLPEDLSEMSTSYLQSLQQELASVVADRTIYLTALEAEEQSANKRFYEKGLEQYDERIKALKQKLKDEAKKISGSSMVTDPLRLSQDIVNKLLNIDGEIKAATAKINALQNVVGQYSKRLDALPVKVLELARLERRRQVDEQTYMMMTQKLEETKIQEAAQAKNVRIIDEAIQPLAPVSPKKKLNLLLGVLIGVGLGVAITFLLDYLDNSVRTPDDVERQNLNILSTIPKIRQDKLDKELMNQVKKPGTGSGEAIESRLITHLDPKSPVSESYRTLRTNLQFSKVDRKLQTLLVTSSGPKEGKSTTAANLSIALAQTGSRVVLIDADLRRPILHSLFGIDKESGLTNYLLDVVSYKDMIRDTMVKNLKLIPSGTLPPNPSELLASRAMEKLLKRLHDDFDTIVLDSPPVIAVTDAVILSTKVDGTILVVYASQTAKEALKRAKNLLSGVESNLLGVLLNGIDIQGMYGSYYYYYYYHHYYAKPGKHRRRRIPKFF